jgi:Zn finger protein HypA/HybF involved in hydrogenase expression
LHQDLVPGRACCDRCGTEWRLDFPVFVCAECGGAARPVSGEEFEVESIEVVEVEDREVAHASH